MKTIGVVIATYNGEKFIIEQLKSIISQTLPPSFIVVSDGMSTDSTLELCKNYLESTPIPHLILESPCRLSVTPNFERGLLACDCDYILFSDQDDVWLPDKIKKTIVQMEKYGASMAFTNAQVTDKNLNFDNMPRVWDTVGYQQTEHIKCYPKCDLSLIPILCQGNIVSGMSMCITSDIKQLCLPLPPFLYHDEWIALLSACNHKIIAIDEAYVLYRQHGNNVVGIGKRKSLITSLKNGRGYFSRVSNGKLKITEILNRAGQIMNKDCEVFLQGCAMHTENRIQFLKGNKSILYPIRNLHLYKTYDRNYQQIILRDYISRFFF